LTRCPAAGIAVPAETAAIALLGDGGGPGAALVLCPATWRDAWVRSHEGLGCVFNMLPQAMCGTVSRRSCRAGGLQVVAMSASAAGTEATSGERVN
jgi:hypothetical protein